MVGPQIIVPRQTLLKESLEKEIKELHDIAVGTFQVGTMNKDPILIACSKHTIDDCRLLLSTIRNYFRIIEKKL